MALSRRDFLKGLLGLPFLFHLLKGEDKMSEAMFYRRMAKGRVQCQICFRRCLLAPGERSFCRNRINYNGRLYSLVYGHPSAVHIDPIEKEPVHHMLPGSKILCFGTAGCNFRCQFCQNWHLSQRSIEEMEVVIDLPPEEGIRLAQKEKVPTLSFTYNEPTSFYEYVYDLARLAKKNGIRVIFHSNGSMQPEPLRALLRFTDAVTIDLKSFREEFYRNVSGATLRPVLETLRIIREEGKWLEIVNLLIPGLNDDPDDIHRMAVWIRDNLGDYTPLHFSRFFPHYRLKQLLPTPIKTLERAYDIARSAGLKFVSIGNVPGHRYNSTYCPVCGKRLIYRIHFTVIENRIKDGRCPFCQTEIPGIWSP